MGDLQMSGPFDLNNFTIDQEVSLHFAGNYALGEIQNGHFYPCYIGRSDSDLNQRLKDHVREYSKFKFSYALSSELAFYKECRNYHEFGGSANLANSIHPDRPKGTNFKCPCCAIY